MTNRREFLQIGVAASALPLAAPAARGSEPLGALESAASAVPLYKVVYDVRFPDSVAFARRAAAQGVAVQAIEGDMTRFWYDDLYHRWQRGPAAIAGLTAHGALFCFERLALDQRMRVVFRAEHAAAAGAVQHRVDAPLPLLHEARRAAAADAWAARFADLVTRCPGGRTELGTFDACGPGALAAAAEPLYTWVIAPARRAAARV
ncbi:MAG TPA: hypothetical protein VFO94_07855 [Gammaproteobacteria bacterium]|nr:hypothetical protein [Gammaproteobacteria bacterium]